jgi:hypothetical protein
VKKHHYRLVSGLAWKLPVSWKSRLSIIFLALGCQYLIQYNAIKYIKEIYNYYSPHELSISEILVSSVWCMIPTVMLPIRTNAACCASWVYYSFIYLSASSIGVTMLNTIGTYSSFMAYLLMGLAIIYFVSSCSKVHLPVKIKVINVSLSIYLLAIFLAIYAWYLSNFCIHFGIEDVYVRRMEARESIGIGGYPLALLRLLLPLLAIYLFIIRKNPVLLLIVIVGSIGIFSYDGTKSSILYLGLIALFAVGIKNSKLPLYLLSTIFIINLVGITENLIIGGNIVLDYIVRRAFVMPGWLSSIYWTYIPTGNNIDNLPYLVGEQIFGMHQINECNANTNFMMWGWVWLKWIGGFLVSFITGTLVFILNQVCTQKHPGLGALLASGCMLIWSEQFLHTSMFSSGIIWVILVAILANIVQSSKLKLNII